MRYKCSLVIVCALAFGLPCTVEAYPHPIIHQVFIHNQAQVIQSEAGSQQEQDIHSQFTEVNNLIASADGSHHKEANRFVVAGWAVNIVMISKGVILISTGVGAGLGAALIVAGIEGIIMTSPAGSKTEQGLTQELEKMGIAPIDASILATMIITVVMIAATMGAGSAATVQVEELNALIASAALDGPQVQYQ